MRLMLICAAAAVAVAMVVPTVAQAWTPEDCAAWYEQHGSNHPDCSDYVPPPKPQPVPVCRGGVTVHIPENEVVPGDQAGECVPPPAPPVVPPVVAPPPPVVTPPPVVDVPVGGEVEGKEHNKPGRAHAHPSPDAAPVAAEQQAEAAPQTGVLPFTGTNLVWVVVLGVALVAGGVGVRRLVA